MAKTGRHAEGERRHAFASMIDIVFLLLIFFVLQPFRTGEARLASHLPKNGTGKVRELTLTRTIRLAVLPDAGKGKGVFLVNRVAVPDRVPLASRLRAAAQGDPNVPVVIAPDPRVHFRYVLEALDQCHVTGMKDIKFAASP